MDWTILNAVVLISPFLWVWGLAKYINIPVRSAWRSRASAIGLLGPLLSIALWAATLLIARTNGLTTSAPLVQHLVALGIWIPTLGMLIGLAGRPLLILAIVPSSVGAVLFWYATTLP